MQKIYIRNIILLFFGKHFSKGKQILFGRWLLSPDDSEKKEDLLRELWDKSPSHVSLSTYQDWKTIRKSINEYNDLNNYSKFKIKWQKYAIAAAIVVMVMVIPATILIKNKFAENIELTEMVEVFVSHGETKEIILPDNSRAWINAGSLLVYPKSFDNINSRTIYLTGEGSFEVTENREKPFIVKTAHLNVKALGTVFTVQAYSSDQFTLATLEEGSVCVDINADVIKPSVLKRNEQLRYSHSDRSVSISTIDASLLQKTRDGYQIFENTSFQELIKSLERKYNVVIHYDAYKYANNYNYYNVKFAPNESIEDVLDVLKQLTGLRFKIDGNVVYIN